MAESESFRRYLSILEVEEEPPSLGHLCRLVRSQLRRVPFENVSKLFLKKTEGADFIPSLEAHLDGIEHRQFGGTCYANNPHFGGLLRYLGYDVNMCGAEMSRPDVHIVNIVRVDGCEYLVDVGYAAPFYEPMPTDLDHDLEIAWGTNRYVLHPKDDHGRSRMDLWRDGKLVHGYRVDSAPRDISHFERVIRDSYDESATFMNILVIERFFRERSLRFHNFNRTESTPDRTSTVHLGDLDQLAVSVEAHAGIRADIVLRALVDLPLEGEIYT
jgi:arylamine N-acetyltransferase